MAENIPLILGLANLLAVLPLATKQANAQEPAANISAGQNEEKTARGLLRAPVRVEIRTQLNALIAEMPFLEGHQFSKGDLLIGFDCSRYEAEAAAAKAGANAAWIDYKSKKRLLAHAAIGKDEVQLSQARASQASAEVSIHEATNSGCRITAPFDGRVVAVKAREHEYPTAEHPLITIVDDSRLEVEMVVPSNWLTWLKAETRFKFRIEETAVTVDGRIDRLAGEIDPVSQTVRVFGVLDAGRYDGMLAGMSGTAVFLDQLDG